MANIPSEPQDGAGASENKPAAGNGAASVRARATIVLKNPTSNSSTSSAKMQPVATPGASSRMQAAPPGASGRSPAVPISNRAPAVSGRSAALPPANQSVRKSASQIQSDREALGLTAARPSEMVKGLDEAAKRAEALAEREEAKRKSGGKLNANTALHVDDTGKRWSNWVKMGIIGTTLFLLAAGSYLVYRTANPPLNERLAYETTRSTLKDLARAAELMPRFDSSEKVTVPAVKERLHKSLQDELTHVTDQAKKDRDAKRNPDPNIVSRRDFLQNMLEFKDGWNRPLNFTIEDDSLVVIGAAPLAGKQVPEAERARVREGSSEKPVEKPVEKTN